MKKKAIKYLIIFLIIPLLLSLSIAIATNGEGFNNNEKGEGELPNYDDSNEVENIKRSDTYIYFNAFIFVFTSCGILFYIKKKRGI